MVSLIYLCDRSCPIKLLPKNETTRARSPCRDAFPAELLAVARRPSGLRVKSHVAQNIPTLKLYLSNLG